MNNKLTKVIFFIIFVLLATELMAHAPSRIEMDFEKEESILSVKVVHPVADPDNHFVKKVEVFLGEDKIIEQVFGVQTDNGYQIAKYLIHEAEEGMEIRVKSICSIHGERTATIKIEKNEEKE